MRNMRWSMAASGLVVFGALGWVMGCSASSGEDLTDPKLGSNAKPTSGSSSSSGGGGSPSTTSGSGSSGTGGVAPGCDPTDSTFVSDMCGVFVALAGKTGAAGTMTDPLPSLTEGIDAAVKANKYVFACADTFNEQVKIKTGLNLFGGREDCMKGWALKAGGATTISGPVDKIALTIDTPGQVTLENVDVVAPAGTKVSKSSIAVLVSQAEADFKNCNFTSNDAFAGDDGAMIAYDMQLDGTPGLSGKAVCAPGNHPGGVAVVKSCGGVMSTGGKGGNGGAPGGAAGGNAADGMVSDAAGVGTHGNGEGALACTPGGQGGPGSKGMDGAGATGIGSISMSGYLGASGLAGGAGKPGVGGGGGGGSKGTLIPIITACSITDPTDYFGASGGSGGSGGCGGMAGNVGGPGGSSIALLVLAAKSVKFDTVTLTPGKGGAGGMGGSGQLGGAQGAFGIGGDATNGGNLAVGCPSGAGGSGGAGGPGGGGQGGHSLGLASKKGTMLPGMPTYPKTPPQPGAGGLAGSPANDPAVGKGVAGNSTAPTAFVLEFP